MRSLRNGPLIVVALSFSGAIAVGYLIWRSRRKQTNKPADEWHYVGQLRDITLYPIKSTAGIMLDESECVDIGLQHEGFNDRQFVLMQANGKLMFAGAYPQMLGIKANIVGERIIRFTAPNMPALEVNIASEFLEPLGKKRKGIKELKKTGFTLRLVEGDEEQHKWFSRAIFKEETGARLFLNLKPKVHNKWWNRGVSDFFPLMVLHSRSVNDLNKRLPQEDHVDPAQFRGNLLIDTSATPNIPPYDEDHWQWIMIGFNPEHSVILQYNSYCYRCILPNINVETLERNKNFEPLRTLKSYRLLDNPEEPVMGVYYNVYKQGSLQRGAEVYVQYRKRELEKS